MPRSELDDVQNKLKEAIQNHQNIVSQLTSDPYNQDNLTELRNLQSQITVLSDQQRLVVQKLRQELLQKENNMDLLGCSPQPAHQHNKSPPIAHSGSNPTSLHSPLSPSFLDANTDNSIPADLSLKSTKVTYISPSCIKSPSFDSSTTTQGSVNLHPLRVPNISSILSTSPEVDKPLFINVSSNPTNSSHKTSKSTGMDKKAIKRAKKLAFMSTIDLVTLDMLQDIQSKQKEPRSRFGIDLDLGLPEETEKKHVVYLMSPTDQKKKRPASTQAVQSQPLNKKVCHTCQKVLDDSTSTKRCQLCSTDHHVTCAPNPNAAEVTPSSWTCASCEEKRHISLKGENLAVLHAYIAKKASKEDEKKKLEKRGIDLINEKILLETRSAELTQLINKQAQEKKDLIAYNHKVQESVNNLKNFVRVFQS